MKIGQRLAAGFAAILLLSTLTSAVGIQRLQAVAQATSDVMEQPLAKERMISDWYRNIAGGVLRTKAIAKSNEPSMASVFAEDAALSAKTSDELRKKIEPLLETADEKDLYAQIVEQRKKYVAAREKVMQLKKAGDAEEATKVFDAAFLPSANAYQGLMRDLVELQRSNMDGGAKTIVTSAASSRMMLLGLAALALAIGVAGAWRLTLGIVRPLRQACVVARRVASGNLTGQIAVTGNDETAELLWALKGMNDGLAKMVGDIRDGTTRIAATTVTIASGNQDLSARTEEQASALEETASSMEEITSTVKQNAANAHEANQLAQAASAVARKGGAVVAQVVGTMSAINASSRRITDIIAVIDGIAFQTNILALNAAVEAARAGEQGRGFAVVAAEVRNLAQRSASAAKEVKELISQSGINVDAGQLLVSQAGQTMQEIVDSVDRVQSIIAEIRLASSEQAEGIQQVNQAISQMDAVTQKNAALVERAARDAQFVHTSAAELDGTVQRFVLA
jgi:methyl-accepting chemotaxis protein